MEIMTINNEEWVKKSDAAKTGSISLKDVDISNYWTPGNSLHIETVTKYYTGTLILRDDTDVYLKNASWIQSTGYFSDYIQGKSSPAYSEPLDPDTVLCIPRGIITSYAPREIVLELIR